MTPKLKKQDMDKIGVLYMTARIKNMSVEEFEKKAKHLLDLKEREVVENVRYWAVHKKGRALSMGFPSKVYLGLIEDLLDFLNTEYKLKGGGK